MFAMSDTSNDRPVDALVAVPDTSNDGPVDALCAGRVVFIWANSVERRSHRTRGIPPLGCSCELWPNYIHEHRERNVIMTQSTTTSDTAGLTGLVDDNGEAHKFAYWRPGGRHNSQRFYYNAVVTKAWKVSHGNRTCHVVAVN